MSVHVPAVHDEKERRQGPLQLGPDHTHAPVPGLPERTSAAHQMQHQTLTELESEIEPRPCQRRAIQCNVYLALALWRACRLDEFAAAHIPLGKEEVPWEKIATVLVVARLCEPSSELHIAEDWYRRTALSDLLQLNDALVNKDRLYRALDQLLPHKAALEAHLSKRVGELFAIDNEVLLYDVTSTYFEGQAEGNPQAQRGA